MKATRRNVLVILGVMVIAGGALFGTGAFTTVEADRSVDVNTATDENAQLGLSVDDPLGGTNDTIEFSEDQLNMDAVTYYNNSFTVSNNDNDGTSLSSLTIEDGSGNSIVDNYSAVMYFVEESNSVGAGSGDIAEYTVVFDTTNGDISQVPDEITIVAES